MVAMEILLPKRTLEPYTYDGTKLNQVVNITDENYESHISHFTQDVSYTPFNKIDTITEQTEGGLSLVYLYGPDMERRAMVMKDGEENQLRARKYIGLFEILCFSRHPGNLLYCGRLWNYGDVCE